MLRRFAAASLCMLLLRCVDGSSQLPAICDHHTTWCAPVCPHSQNPSLCGAVGSSRCARPPCAPPANPLAEIIAARLAATRPILPRSGSVIARGRLRFGYFRQRGAGATRLQICADRQCASVLADVAAEGNAMAPPVPLPSGTLYWRLSTTSDGGRRDFTPLWRFTLVEDPPADAEGFRPPEPDSLPPPTWSPLPERPGCSCERDGVSTLWLAPRIHPIGDVNGDGVLEAFVEEKWMGIWCIGRNNSGYQDLMLSITSEGADGELVWSGGTRLCQYTGRETALGYLRHEVLAVGDFDGDGYSDYVTSFDRGIPHVVLQTTIGEVHGGTACALSTLRSVGDMDGDLRPELFCGDGYASLIQYSGFHPLRVPRCASVGDDIVVESTRLVGGGEAIDANGDPFTDFRVPVRDPAQRARWLVYEGGPGGLRADRCALRP